jgi:serine-type D-Ala-D-Ala carboxypeptidase/endopeptidase (penicillin-binding protein 4)
VRSTRVVTLVTLALLNVFTLVAGVAIARMLPAKLAAMKVPVAVTGETHSATSVLQAPSASAPVPTEAGLRAVIDGALPAGSKAVVVDGSTGTVLYNQDGSTESTPDSTTKILTATAALAALGADTRFTTKVVLVGGGDPDLAVHSYPASDYPQPATLADLAAQTAKALKSSGLTTVQLSYDTSLYSGPLYAPGWSMSDVTTGNVTPIVSLEVDQGRLTANGQPEDDDDATNYSARTTNPAGMAVTAFAGLLSSDGITVSGTPSQVTAPAGATTIAAVRSPTVAQLIQQMLTESNNVIAENLGRHVAIATGRSATFAGAAAGVEATVRRVGVTAGVHLFDTSGLSPNDDVAPMALVEAIEAAARTGSLRPVLTGLPIAGFDGTLSTGDSIFGAISGAARGVVRAKTGNLDTSATLAGLVVDSDGHLLIFALMTAGYPGADLQVAANGIDATAEALASCGCR